MHDNTLHRRFQAISRGRGDPEDVAGDIRRYSLMGTDPMSDGHRAHRRGGTILRGGCGRAVCQVDDGVHTRQPGLTGYSAPRQHRNPCRLTSKFPLWVDDGIKAIPLVLVYVLRDCDLPSEIAKCRRSMS